MEEEKSHPKDDADCFSVLLFIWIRKLLYTGWKRTLTEEDVYPTLHTDHSAVLGSQLEYNWFQDLAKSSKTNSKPCFRRTIFRTFAKRFLYYGLFSMLEECVLRMIQVISLGHLIDYFSLDHAKLRTKAMALLACAGIILSSVAFVISFHWSFYCAHHVCTHMRLAVSSLIYRKTLRLSQATLRNFSVGQLITMLSSDVHRLDQKDLCLNYLWIAPLHISIVIYLLYWYYEFGLASLGGLLLLVIFVIFQYIMSKYISKVRLQKIGAMNKRLRIVSEIIQAFNTIKLYAWEDIFYDKAKKSRNEELKFIKKTMILRILNTSLSLILTKMTVFLTILFYVYYDDRPPNSRLDSRRVFITLLLYEHVRINLAFLFTRGVNDFAEVSVTFVRMTEFLLLEEKYVDPASYIVHQVQSFDQLLDVPFNGISMDSVTCKWHPEQETPTLDNISLELTEGKLVALVGSIGSGKSSLLSALLGELAPMSGTITCQGQISYVSQTPWLFPGTIRQNIVFGKRYNASWYEEVIEICALTKDLESMTEGDQTKVLHAGLSLGQKARISLARAVYSNSDIYLMDDPLNCVDVRISRHILEVCIRGALKNKAVLLVTHQIHFLEAADNIAILMGGKIRAIGTFKELMNAGIEFANEVEDFIDDEDFINEEFPEYPEGQTGRRSSIMVIEEEEDHLIVKELIPDSAPDAIKSTATDRASTVSKINTLMLKGIGSSDEKMIQPDKIGIKLYWSYVKSSSSLLLVLSAVVLCLLAQLFYTGSDLWLELWIHVEEKRASGHATENIKEKIMDLIHSWRGEIIVYCSLTASLVVFTILRGIVMFRICVKSSLTLFCQLLKSLLHSKAKLVDTSYSGQGINRFSKDMVIVDELLPITLYEITGVFFEIGGAVVLLCVIYVWFLIPCLIFLAMSMTLFHIYHPTASALKRLESNSRSPVYAHTMKTLEGLTSIRAYEQERVFLKIYDDLQDRHTAKWTLYVGIHTWLALAVDWSSILLIASISIGFVYFTWEVDAATVGLAIAKVIELSILMQIAVHEAGNSEAEMIAVERILEYTNEESEAQWEIPENKPSKDWPHIGRIVFKNVFVDGFGEKSLLKDFSCEIEGAEKIGIVGASGSGKSSVINALFRVNEPKSGIITIDDVNILELGLHDLRKKISVIPQVPHVFAGTLRMNLDPYDEFPDAELWDVLDEVHLFDTVKTLECGLDTEFTEIGWHFSAGQSQLLSLARVMLEKNQIICCDQATANLDPQTQCLLLKKVREHFHNCTVLSIAHRLHTIVDCDKILVLESGQLVDFGQPHDLLQQKGPFYSLVMQLGKKNADDIVRLAKENSTRKAWRRESIRRASIKLEESRINLMENT